MHELAVIAQHSAGRVALDVGAPPTVVRRGAITHALAVVAVAAVLVATTAVLLVPRAGVDATMLVEAALLLLAGGRSGGGGTDCILLGLSMTTARSSLQSFSTVSSS